MRRRTQSGASIAACLTVVGWTMVAIPRAGGEPSTPPLVPSDDVIHGSLDRGVAWLVAAQKPDGSWGSGGFRGSVAVTANAALALVAAGNTPTSGRHADAVARGVAFLLDAADEEGLFDAREPGSRGPMYGQAYATLLLAELMGEVDAPSLPGLLRRSAALLEATQNEEGGWRYQPTRGDADVSVTSTVVVAIAALERSGIDVSRSCVERAIVYLRRLQNDDGGFRYMASAGESAAPRTAAAILALATAGTAATEDGRVAIERAAAWLARHPVGLEAANAYALYGVNASTAAFWQTGGDAWRDFFGRAAAELVAAQQPDGSWNDPSCREYGTAAAVMALAVPDGLIPVLQP